MAQQPVVLSIAGSDSGGGAGIQADLRACWDHGVPGTTAIAAITAQHTRGVTRIDAVPVAGLVAQVDAIFDDMQVGAVKIGMLGTAQHVRATAEVLRRRATGTPVVLDPVMVATSGDRLLAEDAVVALREALVPLATLITPNLPELRILAGVPEDAPRASAEAALELGASVLVTGGDEVTDDVVDVLLGAEGRVWRHPRIAGGPFHGTGCTLSSAIAARMCRGESMHDAIDGAIDYVRQRLAASIRLGGGSAVGGFIPHPV